MSIFTQRNAGVFLQFQPGKQPYYLGDCVDIDSIPNPRFGGIDLVQCWNRRRDGFKTLGKKKSPPGAIEFTLTELHGTAVSWLEKVHCPFTIYALLTQCGEPGVFANWERAAIVPQTEILDDPITNQANHVSDDEVMHEFSLSGVPPRVDPRPLSVGRQDDYAGTNALNAIAPCGNLYCGDNCQGQTEPCDNWITAGDGGAGKPDVQYTGDGGVDWVAAAAEPFANTEEIASAVCFEIATGVNRWLVVRGPTAAKGFYCAYSDDGGATWTEVEISATVLEGAVGPKALFAFDMQHVWTCSDAGEVYFSDDGGETWTNQASGVVAGGGNDLVAIDFADENIGYIVGDSDTIIYTTDGGEHWIAGTATGTGDNLTAVSCFSQFRVLVGTDNSTAGGSLWITFDGTATWEDRDFVGHATEGVVDMDFYNDYVGLIITGLSTSASDAASIHHTIDGGWSWKELIVPDNAGLNAIRMCDVNEAIAVGEVYSGTAAVMGISG